MKNRDFMIAGSLLLGLGLMTPAQAQKNADQLFFYGFEDNMTSFKDSSNVLDTISKLRYYIKEGSNGAFTDVETWTLDPVIYDTLLLMWNGVQPCQDNDKSVRANDTYDCIYEETDAHSKAMSDLGAVGGNYYLHFKTDKNVKQSTDAEKTAESGDYQGCLFIRDIPIEDYTSYRLVYYRKTNQPDKAKMYSGILRGFYNSEKSLSMNGESGNEFMLHETTGITSTWQRVTVMAYYQNDSVANHHCYAAGYWWTSSWNRMAADGSERIFIEQPDKFFVRLTFSAPDVDYFIDDIALYKSWIGGAEYNKDIIRVDFGYQTNLKALAQASPLKAIELPGEYFTITGIDSFSTGREENETDEAFIARGGTYERDDIPALSAEYHDDGFMYIFLQPDNEGYPQDCAYYGDVRISFNNPIKDMPGMGLKYTGTLYPMSLDTVWAKTKIVPDFSNEFVLPNAKVSATPVKRLAPTATKINPVNGSFKLPVNTQSIKVYFNKPVYVDPSHTTTKGVKAVFKKNSSGEEESWFAASFNAADSSVVFTRESTTDLSGDYLIQIIQARADANFAEAPVAKFTLEFGAAGPAPIVYAKDNFQSLNKGEKNVAGFSKLNNTITYYISEFKGLYPKALMWGMYATSGLSASATGEGRLFYKYTFEAAGQYKVSFGLTGCNKGSWNDAANVDFRIYKSTKEMGDTLLYKQLGGSSNKPDEGGTVTAIDEFSYVIDVPSAGEFTFEWRLPNESSSSGHKGGRVMYYFEVSNLYTIAQQSMRKVDDALISAGTMKGKAEADINFSGAVLDALKAVITKYTGYTTSTEPVYTNPADYTKVASEIAFATGDMGTRISQVNSYFLEYHKTDSIANSYNETDTANLAVVIAAKSLVAANVSLDVPATTPADLTVIITSLQAAQKAISDRQVLNYKFIKLANDVVNTLDVKSAYNFFAEYPALEAAYNANKDQNIITGTDAEVNAAINAMQSALNAFNGKLDGALAMAHQAKLLYDLAVALEVDFGASAEEIEQIMSKLDNDNANLVAALKLAIKAKLYAMIAAGTEIPADLDLSGFITNPGLYCTAVIGTEVEQYNYTYGTPNTRWRAKKTEFTTVYPGWKFKANAGNVHVGSEVRNWAGASPVFDGYVAADWSSGFTMNQTVTELPLGIYNIGVGYNNNQSNAGCNFVVASDGQDTIYRDTVVVNNGSEDYPAAPNVFVEDMPVSVGSVNIKVNHANVNGWTRLDNFALTFKAGFEAGVDYATLAAELQTAADAAIAEVVTGVEKVTVSGSVKYYNLNGIRLAAPQKGINIKVTTGADGKRVSEKILVK